MHTEVGTQRCAVILFVLLCIKNWSIADSILDETLLGESNRPINIALKNCLVADYMCVVFHLKTGIFLYIWFAIFRSVHFISPIFLYSMVGHFHVCKLQEKQFNSRSFKVPRFWLQNIHCFGDVTSAKDLLLPTCDTLPLPFKYCNVKFSMLFSSLVVASGYAVQCTVC